MNYKRYTLAAVLVAMLAMAVPAFAHHSFTAEFDGSREFVVKGVLTRVLWTNPHITLYMDVMQPDGKTVEYEFSSGPPSILHKAGMHKDDFKIGDTVTITAAPAKDQTKNLGWLKMIKYSDGHVFVYRDGSE